MYGWILQPPNQAFAYLHFCLPSQPLGSGGCQKLTFFCVPTRAVPYGKSAGTIDLPGKSGEEKKAKMCVYTCLLADVSKTQANINVFSQSTMLLKQKTMAVTNSKPATHCIYRLRFHRIGFTDLPAADPLPPHCSCTNEVMVAKSDGYSWRRLTYFIDRLRSWWHEYLMVFSRTYIHRYVHVKKIHTPE